MKPAWWTYLFIFTACSLGAQNIESRTFGAGRQAIEYSRFLDHSDPGVVLLAFVPADTLFPDPQAWAAQVYPLADKNGWLLLSVPYNDPSAAEYWKSLDRLLAEEMQALPAHLPLYVLSRGCGASFGFPGTASRLPDAHVIVAPGALAASVDGRLFDNRPVALVEDQSPVAGLRDSLSQAGAWVRSFALSREESKGGFMACLPAVDRALVWADSLSGLLRDSVRQEALRNQVGVVNELPGVVREGRPIRLEVFVPSPAECRFELLDLSGKAMWQVREFRGRGKAGYDIPTRGLPWGVYQLEVEVGSYINRHKVIIRG